MMRRRIGLARDAVACRRIAIACYGPTEVRLDISTDEHAARLRDQEHVVARVVDGA
jgi:hypothetical protein